MRRLCTAQADPNPSIIFSRDIRMKHKVRPAPDILKYDNLLKTDIGSIQPCSGDAIVLGRPAWLDKIVPRLALTS